MQEFTPRKAEQVHHLIQDICRYAGEALQRTSEWASADEMSADGFKALAKEVEEAGELIDQLEKANPRIVPALFEVPHGRWSGWSGLENYRNVLAHEFKSVTPEELFVQVKCKLALQDVFDLLSSVATIGMTADPFHFGVEAEIRNLPRSADTTDLRPGASLISLRFEKSGELMAVRSWRDDQDNWRGAVRWVRSEAESRERIKLYLTDTEMKLEPWPVVADNDEHDRDRNLFAVPPSPYYWHPRVIGQDHCTQVRKRTL